MKKTLLFFISFVYASVSLAQKIDSVAERKDDEAFNQKIFTAVEYEPHFPGWANGFKRYLANNLVYPEIARLKNIRGSVLVSFVIERDGSLSDFKISRGVSQELDAEALRLMKNSPKWVAGVQNGRTARVAYSVFIAFPQEPIQIPKDTAVFYIKKDKDNELLVKSRDLADFYRVVLPPDTTLDKTLLIINEFYKNGRKKMIGSAVVLDHQLLLSGSCMEFYENGKRKSVKNYVDGAVSGDFYQFYPNGQLYITGEYDQRGRMIIKESRDSTGKVLASDGAGLLVRYTDDFKKIIEQGPIVGGVEEGEWYGIAGDSVSSVYNYVKGNFQSGKSFDKRGQMMASNLAFTEPTFPGGMAAFYKFLQVNIKYPHVARDNNIQGKVLVSFIIERDGSLTDLHVTQGAGSGLDEEATRVIRLSSKWVPGIQGGIPVRFQYNMPISFSLQVEDYRK